MERRTPTPQHPRGLYAVAFLMIGITSAIMGMFTRRWIDGEINGWDLAIACGETLMWMAFVSLCLCWWRQAVLRKWLAEYQAEQMRVRGELPARDMEFNCKTAGCGND